MNPENEERDMHDGIRAFRTFVSTPVLVPVKGTTIELFFFVLLAGSVVWTAIR